MSRQRSDEIRSLIGDVSAMNIDEFKSFIETPKFNEHKITNCANILAALAQQGFESIGKFIFLVEHIFKLEFENQDKIFARAIAAVLKQKYFKKSALDQLLNIIPENRWDNIFNTSLDFIETFQNRPNLFSLLKKIAKITNSEALQNRVIHMAMENNFPQNEVKFLFERIPINLKAKGLFFLLLDASDQINPIKKFFDFISEEEKESVISALWQPNTAMHILEKSVEKLVEALAPTNDMENIIFGKILFNLARQNMLNEFDRLLSKIYDNEIEDLLKDKKWNKELICAVALFTAQINNDTNCNIAILADFNRVEGKKITSSRAISGYKLGYLALMTDSPQQVQQVVDRTIKEKPAADDIFRIAISFAVENDFPTNKTAQLVRAVYNEYKKSEDLFKTILDSPKAKRPEFSAKYSHLKEVIEQLQITSNDAKRARAGKLEQLHSHQL